MPGIIERLRDLIEFAKQSALLRASPAKTVAQHKQFYRFEEKIRALPGLSLNFQLGEFDEIWLRLERLHEIHPPVPASNLLGCWLELSNSPTVEPKLRLMAESKRLMEIGALRAGEIDESGQPQFLTLDQFQGKEAIQRLFQAYVETAWKRWAAEEKERRKSIALYGELFMLSLQMQGNLVDSQLEFVWGVGVAVWNQPLGLVTYPLMTQLVEISLNEQDMSLEVRPRSGEPRLEVDIYTAQDNPGVANLVSAGKAFFTSIDNGLSPFEPSTYDGLLRSAANFLDPHGVYWPSQTGAEDRTLPKGTENLVVTDTWVLFARPRTSSLFVQDMERFERALDGSHLDLPEVVAALVTDPSDTTTDVILPSFRGLSMVGFQNEPGSSPGGVKELYFPMPYNDEQVQIIQNLELHDGVVVQGPPGTGKTHTIANVICHYLALGKRVLVTSMKDQALEVLQEKIPSDIRPLAISLLTSEAEGMKQFEFAINKISSEVQCIDRSAYRQEIERIDGRIEHLHGRIAWVDRQIAGWASKNLDPISIDGRTISPADAAKEVAINRSEIDWLRDRPSIEDGCEAQFGHEDVIELREARRQLGQDLLYLDKTSPLISGFPEGQKLLQAHRDLARLSELNSREADGDVPSLLDNTEDSLQAALALTSSVSNLRLLIQDLANARQPWISGMQTYLRGGASVEILELFRSLLVEIVQTLGERKNFLKRPLSAPQNLDQNDEIIQAVRNLALGAKPFGISGIFGKSEQKKVLGAIYLLDERPKGTADWEYAHSFLTQQKKSRALLARWNALASEIPLPRIDTSPDRLSFAGQAINYFYKLEKVILDEAVCLTEIRRLMPSWRRIEDYRNDLKVLEEAEAHLTHHLIRHRLGQTWAVKETFLNVLSGTTGEISERIRLFLNHALGNSEFEESIIQAEWSSLMDELRRIWGLAPYLRTVGRVTGLIEASGAAIWAQDLRENPHSGSIDSLLPDNWKEIWRLRRLTTFLDGIDARDDLKRLAKERGELENDLAKQYRDAVTKRTWLQLSLNATDSVRSALEAYRSAIRKIGKGTGVRAVRYRQDARVAAERAYAAIPCWIMPHYRVCESLPASFGCFDLVIIDEASQSDLSALPAILRAKKMLIVGDDKQVSPEGVGLEEEKIRNLMGRYLSKQVDLYRAQMTPERSIYDLFKVVFAKSSVMLREHFRCVAPIIEYSKREYYNHELQPLRIPKSSERFDPPLIDVFVEDGYRHGDFNEPEARFIVDEIQRIVQNPALDRRSIGVVSLVGNEQALRVMQMINNTLGEEVVTRFHITCGDARTFQGKDRDIMFLSMVVAPGKVTAQNHEMFAQRFNVAASRARDRMYLVRSIGFEDLSPADILRSRLIQHFQTPFGQNPEEVADLRILCESPFEREVFDILVKKGYRVIPQVPVGKFRIDLVVEGDNDARLAVECDGDQYHGPGQWDQDMRRQRILERAGWIFWRCFASTFVLEQQRVIDDLLETLSSHGITPASSGSFAKSIHSEQRRVRSFAPMAPVYVGTTPSDMNEVESVHPQEESKECDMPNLTRTTASAPAVVYKSFCKLPLSRGERVWP